MRLVHHKYLTILQGSTVNRGRQYTIPSSGVGQNPDTVIGEAPKTLKIGLQVGGSFHLHKVRVLKEM